LSTARTWPEVAGFACLKGNKKSVNGSDKMNKSGS